MTVNASTCLPGLAIQESEVRQPPQHAAVVRVTHWIHAISFIALVVSGICILLAHPRMYWGETGTVGMRSLFDLPLPFVLDLGLRGPGRSVHFLAAWLCALSGLIYVISGLHTQHFRKDLLPRESDFSVASILKVVMDHLRLKRPTEDDSKTYNIVQRVSYLAVVFVLLPFMFVSGFAMSPAITSVFPVIVNVFGGHQTARTLHFFAANLLVIFLVVHISMVGLAGFIKRTRAMITGYPTARKKRS